MSLAAETRAEVRARPFLRLALRAGVCNFAKAALMLDIDGDQDAIATALRRYAKDLPEYAPTARRTSVAMQRGVELAEEYSQGEQLVAIGEHGVVPGGNGTAIIARGDVDSTALVTVLGTLGAADIGVAGAAVADGLLVAVIDSRDGPSAIRVVERALEEVPTRPEERS